MFRTFVPRPGVAKEEDPAQGAIESDYLTVWQGINVPIIRVTGDGLKGPFLHSETLYEGDTMG